MLTLGIETSCDETGIAVTDGARVLSNVVSSSVHLHKKYGGVVPEIASRFHVEFALEVLEEALAKASKRLEDMRLIAVTNGPGLVGALLTGISLAKSLSYSLGVPLAGVNHVLAHLYSAFLNEGTKPDFPFIGLVVSGGHTALFLCSGRPRQKLLGQTLDDAVGESFDKVAKILSLGYPGGPVIEKSAALCADRSKVSFPKTDLGRGSLDFSFSGLKTAVLYYVKGLRRTTHYARPRTTHFVRVRGGRVTRTAMVNNICYAFQENALGALVDKAFLAARIHGVRTIVVGGGVAANGRLREKFAQAAAFSSGVKVYFPQRAYCTDNGAMIAALGEEAYKNGATSGLYMSAQPNLAAA
jgi:N6-L-threonylcarbamoyladenine synthase